MATKTTKTVETSTTSSATGIARPSMACIAVELTGTSPLIQNNFSQKAIEEMLSKQMGITRQREKKKPSEVIENAVIRNVNGEVAMPPTAFKAAMLTATSAIKTFDKKKTLLKTNLFVVGNSIKIRYEKATSRMDMVRLPSGVPDVRFRPQFENWSARILVQYPDTLFDSTSIADLVERSGRVGIGEWRPEKNGTYGTYTVTRAISSREEINEVMRENSVLLQTPTIPEWALDAEIDLGLLAKFAGENVSPLDTSEEAAAPEEADVSPSFVNGAAN